jgi:hypothetical protein
MKKKIITGLLSLVLLLYSLSILTGVTTVVIPLSGYKAGAHTAVRKGEIVSPLKQLDFKKGRWVAYLVIAPADYGDLNPAIGKISCLWSEDAELFRSMQEQWNFKYTGGDLATVSSALYFVRDGKIEFESGIVIDKEREGLQGSEYGWLEPVEKHVLSDSLRRFKRVYWPVVVF